MKTKILMFQFVLLMFSLSLTVKAASSIQVPSLWVFADFNMTTAQFDADEISNQLAVINRIKCILRIPRHLISFNYRNADVYVGLRTSFQILPDTANVVPEKRDNVGQALITSYETALKQARSDGNFEPFSKIPLLGLNILTMKSWISSKVITQIPTDSSDFSQCPANIDYSQIVRNTFAKSLNDTDFDYNKLGTVVQTSYSGNTPTQASNGSLATGSLLGLVVLIMAYILN